jgi:hypothetical protein
MLGQGHGGDDGGGSATFVFLPEEREEAVKGLRMKELNGETALA